MRDGHIRCDGRKSQHPGQKSSCTEPSTDWSADSKFISRSVYCRFKCSLYRNLGFRCLLDSWRAPDEDSMHVCVCPSWRMSSVQAAWQACSAAQGLGGLNPAEALSHTHTATVGSFSNTHNEAKTPGVGTGATGSWFSHSEPVLHPCLGLGLSPFRGAQSGWPLQRSNIVIITFPEI